MGASQILPLTILSGKDSPDTDIGDTARGCPPWRAVVIVHRMRVEGGLRGQDEGVREWGEGVG